MYFFWGALRYFFYHDCFFFFFRVMLLCLILSSWSLEVFSFVYVCVCVWWGGGEEGGCVCVCVLCYRIFKMDATIFFLSFPVQSTRWLYLCRLSSHCWGKAVSFSLAGLTLKPDPLWQKCALSSIFKPPRSQPLRVAGKSRTAPI